MPALLAIALGIFGITYAARPEQTGGFLSRVFGPFLNFGPPKMETIDAIAFSKAKEHVISREGYRNKAYLDTRGKLTVGIGHLVLAGDGISLGQTISDARVNAFFEKDIAGAFAAAKQQALELGKYDADLIAALTSVNYQLGTGWTREFKNTWNDIKSGSVQSAIKRLYQSAWYRQTPVRVADFANALRSAYA